MSLFLLYVPLSPLFFKEKKGVARIIDFGGSWLAGWLSLWSGRESLLFWYSDEFRTSKQTPGDQHNHSRVTCMSLSLSLLSIKNGPFTSTHSASSLSMTIYMQRGSIQRFLRKCPSSFSPHDRTSWTPTLWNGFTLLERMCVTIHLILNWLDDRLKRQAH